MNEQTQAVIVYGTASGNSELVSEAICAGMNEAGLNTQMIKGELIKPEEVKDKDLIVLISPTYNVGKLQEYFEEFFKEFLKLDWQGKPMAVVGLGDSKHYDIFCASADILEEGVKKVNANQIMPTLKIDGLPYDRLEEYKNWGKILAQKFTESNTAARPANF